MTKSSNTLRIFYVSVDRANANVPGNSIWRVNLHDSLVALGCKVHDFGLQRYITHGLQSVADIGRLSSEMVATVKEIIDREGLDLVFTYLLNDWVSPDAIREIRKFGVPVANFYCNSLHQFDLIKNLAPAFDYCCAPEKDTFPQYRRIGANPIYFPYGGNPSFYRTLGLPKDLGIVFVGRQKMDRAAIVQALIENDLPVRVWGPDWHHLIPQRSWIRRALRCIVKTREVKELERKWRKACSPDGLSDAAMVEVFNRADIVLGCSKMLRTDDEGNQAYVRMVNLRDIEAPMCGACYVVEEMDEIHDYYAVGSEIVTYKTEGELVDVTKWLLRNQGTRERIAAAGHRRALREHTMYHRFLKLFGEIGLDRKKIKALRMPVYTSS
ncbi:MAG TPA: glycosyltransferase [Syntrophorhabdales bacterium]|nr:glycosyltransferase [Syntrophorhabdales bacterium]